MNASLPPDNERREEHENEAPQDASAQAASGMGVVFVNLFFLIGVVVVLGFLLLPAIQDFRVPASRSAQAEMEQRQQAIEQAAREASDEYGLAVNR